MQIETALKKELLMYHRRAPAFFESLIAHCFSQSGYGVRGKRPGKIVGRSGDGASTGVIDQDALGA